MHKADDKPKGVRELREAVHTVLDEFTEPNLGERFLSELEESLMHLFESELARATAEAVKEAEIGWTFEAPDLPFFQIKFSDSKGSYMKTALMDTKSLPLLLLEPDNQKGAQHE